jgi:hypothetical protein
VGHLIDFVFKHWYLAILLITLLYQMKNKWLQANKGNTKVQGMPSFGGTPGNASGPPIRPSLSKRPAASALQQKRQQSDYTRPGTDPESTEMPAKKKESPFGPSSPSASPSTSPEWLSNESLLPEQPTSQQILQGIVWSEILGPPRSKKPFRR